MSRIVDLTGKRFGTLTVIGKRKRENGATKWWCRCDCGDERYYYHGNLQQGLSTQCVKCAGRAFGRRMRTHGETAGGRTTPTYGAWRVTRGDRVPEWDRYSQFLADMGEKPVNTRIRRPDRKQPWGPGNCAWWTVEDALAADVEQTVKIMVSAGQGEDTPQLRRRLVGVSRARRDQLRTQAISRIARRLTAANGRRLVDAVRAEARRQGWTPPSLSRATGASRVAANNFLVGRNVRLETFARLASFLGFEMVLGGNGDA